MLRLFQSVCNFSKYELSKAASNGVALFFYNPSQEKGNKQWKIVGRSIAELWQKSSVTNWHKNSSAVCMPNLAVVEKLQRGFSTNSD